MSAKDYQKDYYKTLGVPKTSTAAEIKKAYRELARKYHPDANKGSTDAEERFKEITEAYNVVSDEKQRKEYDEARSMFGGFRVPAGSRPGAGAGAGNFDFGDLFGGEGLGDVIGGIFRGNRPGGGAGTASRARRGADVASFCAATELSCLAEQTPSTNSGNQTGVRQQSGSARDR